MNASNLAIIMFLLILVGYTSRKLNLVDEKFGSGLSKFIFNFVFPAIVIHSMSIPFERGDLDNSITLMVISTLTMVLMFGIARLANLFTGKKDAMAGIMTFALLFPNFTFMAFPVMETLFPDRGLFYITMYTIPTRLAIYIIGPLLIKPKGEDIPAGQLIKDSIRAMLTPPVLAIPIGFLIYFTGMHIPAALGDTLGYLAKTATPMGMALTGIMLADASFRRMFGESRLYLLTALRLVIVPVICYFLLLPFGLDPVVFKIAVLYTTLPVASSTTVFALQYKGDASNAAGSVFLTTVISILTVPLCAYILELVV
ncbi:MAG: AEC family transporter [Saccharofermentanales bacterium]